MQFSRLLKIAALTLCAATISFSVQAQLKNSMLIFLKMLRQKTA